MALYSEYSKDVRQLLIEKDSQISKLENDLAAQQNFYETQLEELKLALETKVMSSCTQEEQEDETLNIKSLFEQIRKVFIEYKETVNLLEKEKATVFKNKFIASFQVSHLPSLKYCISVAIEFSLLYL